MAKRPRDGNRRARSDGASASRRPHRRADAAQAAPDRPRLVLGFHTAEALLGHDPGRILKLWVGGSQARHRALFEAARAAGVTCEALDRDELDRMARSTRHQGVVAEVAPAREWTLDAMLERAAARETPLLCLALDQVTDPRNLGACIRSAAAMGADGVLLPRHRSAGMTETVEHVASGGTEFVPAVEVPNLARSLTELRKHPIQIVGLTQTASRPIDTVDLGVASVLVLGSEDQGLRRLTAELCDILVTVPLGGAVESLNVSVAAGIALYEATRQRRQHSA